MECLFYTTSGRDINLLGSVGGRLKKCKKVEIQVFFCDGISLRVGGMILVIKKVKRAK